MITKRDIAKIIFILFALIGATAGIVLTQKHQNIKEKATNTCASFGGYCTDGGCPQGYFDLGRTNCPVDFRCCKPPICVTEGNVCNDGIPSKRCCEPLICKANNEYESGFVCIKPTTSPQEIVNKTEKGGGQSGCSSNSASNCQGKNPGDNCGSGKKCIALGQKGSDNKPKCSCQTLSSEKGSCNKNPNPTILEIDKDGEITISFASFLESTPPKIALKKNSQSCSLQEYDKLIDTKDTNPNKPIKTGILAKRGDKLCIYGEDVGNNTGIYPFEGWIKPENNKCKDKDISSIIQSVQKQGMEIISQQCWGDYSQKEDCDFNDYILIISLYQDIIPTGNVKILFRQQGVTSQVSSDIPLQLKTFVNLKNKDGSYIIEKATPLVNNDGVWTISFTTDDQGNTIPNGTYDLFIKGISHLKKRFENIKIDGNTTINKATDTKDELRAGDVNNDNVISIEDISQVLMFYTDFKVKVDPSNKIMVGSDINKDGYITINDLALVALNWSNFIIKGD